MGLIPGSGSGNAQIPTNADARFAGWGVWLVLALDCRPSGVATQPTKADRAVMAMRILMVE